MKLIFTLILSSLLMSCNADLKPKGGQGTCHMESDKNRIAILKDGASISFNGNKGWCLKGTSPKGFTTYVCTAQDWVCKYKNGEVWDMNGRLK